MHTGLAQPRDASRHAPAMITGLPPAQATWASPALFTGPFTGRARAPISACRGSLCVAWPVTLPDPYMYSDSSPGWPNCQSLRHTRAESRWRLPPCPISSRAVLSAS